MQTVVMMQLYDVTWNEAPLQPTATQNAIRYRKLDGLLEITCNIKLTGSVASGATLCVLHVGMRPISSAIGTLYRYTSDTDTTPDVRKCTLGVDGKLVNTSGLAFITGYTIQVRLEVAIP